MRHGEFFITFEEFELLSELGCIQVSSKSLKEK